jgi:alpha-tubulin suppressor-like RCC1 family protein
MFNLAPKMLDVALVQDNVIFLDDTGRIWTTGSREFGQGGNGVFSWGFSNVPEPVAGDFTWIQTRKLITGPRQTIYARPGTLKEAFI